MTTVVPMTQHRDPPGGSAAAAARADGRGRLLWPVVALAALVSIVFWQFPGLDVAASRAVYSAPSGFIGEDSPALRLVLNLGRWAGWAAGAILLAVLVAKVMRARWVTADVWRRWWVTMLALALGPGLLVNGLLKAFMGRPRPLQTRLFGGTADFVPVWTYSDGCTANCSFVSGEASFGLFLTVFAFWFSGLSRWIALAAIATFGLAVSLNRIAFGAHFLSDVLLAWGLTAVVILLIDRYLPQRLVDL